jgi:thiol-disulfide isomerase/thioredoxin
VREWQEQEQEVELVRACVWLGWERAAALRALRDSRGNMTAALTTLQQQHEKQSEEKQSEEKQQHEEQQKEKEQNEESQESQELQELQELREWQGQKRRGGEAAESPLADVIHAQLAPSSHSSHSSHSSPPVASSSTAAVPSLSPAPSTTSMVSADGESTSTKKPSGFSSSNNALAIRNTTTNPGKANHTRSSSTNIHELSTLRELQTKVLDYRGPVLLQLYAPWCAPCRRLTPLLKDLIMTLNNNRMDNSTYALSGRYATPTPTPPPVRLVMVDVDTVRPLVARDVLNVEQLPTLLLVYRGRILKRYD